MVNNIVGLPVETLNSLQKLAEAIKSDASVVDTITKAINLSSSVTCVNTQLYIMIAKPLTYDSRAESNIKLIK